MANRNVVRRSDQALISIETGLDQPTPLPTLPQLLLKIDEIVNGAVAEKNPQKALEAGDRLLQVNRLTGPALGRVLYLLSKRWSEFGATNFIDEAFQRWGLSRDTVDRYVKVWEMIETQEIEGEDQTILLQRPMRDQITIAQAWAEHSLTLAQIRRLSRMEDRTTLIEAIDQITDRRRNTDNRKSIRLKRDGTLEVWEHNNRVPLGHLRITPQDMEDPIRARAIERIIRAAGIRRE